MLCTNFFCDFQTIPSAMANLRNIHAICPPEVFEFIMGLFKYNDNSRNKVCRQYDKIFESASNEINLIWMVIV
jgi:transcription initiation factor TFIID subunit 2